ncbi:hypothetical protein ANANG_G00072410 [Anguilla anguilla]|uniref:Uncharacterized protein n=1 Tax=Anguilla anguilla TaxID=7936 RepID=A0A9D3MRA8_ANGAN|nr:hypothetical protein ANANG_G00072410 [Anguilla anguilla]
MTKGRVDFLKAMADALAAGSGAFPRGPHSPDPLLSPMSKLAHCFTGLGATQTGDTPRRCLDLSNISTGSADVAVGPESPCSAPLSDHAQSPQQDSPVPRNSRMKRLKSFLPRLLCSSPKPNSDSHRQGDLTTQTRRMWPPGASGRPRCSACCRPQTHRQRAAVS